MTQFVFALVVTLGAQTVSVEHFAGIETCLYYSGKLNGQHHSTWGHKHQKEQHIHAQCVPARVDPRTTQIFTR